MKTFAYTPSFVCSRAMEIDYEDGKIVDFRVQGGCHGNLQGIASLIRGMEIDEVIAKLQGIVCRGSRNKATSCPDQLAKALIALKQQ